MSLLLQQLLVALAVVACVLLSAWRLLSVRLRLRVLELLGALPLARRARWRVRLRERQLERLAGGCAGCAAGATPADAGAPNQTAGAPRR